MRPKRSAKTATAAALLASMAVGALCLCGCAKPDLFPGSISRDSGGIAVVVDPRLELLSGILSQTEWARESGHGPGGEAYGYANELAAFMDGYRDHPAVIQAQALYPYGFDYDAPPTFALNLEGAGLLAPPAGWSDNLTARPDLVPRLGAFREAFARLYRDSSFARFFASNKKLYALWASEVAHSAELGSLAGWLGGFFGLSGDADFRVVLAPALFPSGGYGPTIKRDGGRNLYVAVLRAAGHGADGPEFPSDGELALLLLHEFGHSFVNPAMLLPDSPKLALGLARLFEPVFPQMSGLSYGDLQTMVDELVLRAAVVVAASDLGLLDKAGTERAIRAEELAGFYPIRLVIELLRRYAGNRAAWPNLAAYAPEILERLGTEPFAIIEAAVEQGLLPSPPVKSFTEGFEGELGLSGLPQGFSLKLGSVLPGPSRLYSEATVVPGEACTGGKALVLTADAATTDFLYASRPIEVMDGEVTASFSVSHDGIFPEGTQYSGSYAGFIVTDRDGVRRFAVRQFRGDSAWKTEEIRLAVDHKAVALEFAVFLNESGTLRVDDIRVEYH